MRLIQNQISARYFIVRGDPIEINNHVFSNDKVHYNSNELERQG